ncbi:hypothetical protein AYI70_g8816 [Smittium culicis]|uniref:Uncharacterized protein n=1 Tax=Smittium culicis TaxID=133412 RepID=A0A1R1XE89_9FUNG|nr:hypothetical protein AYI70_g8816 [Smittium culicis]
MLNRIGVGLRRAVASNSKGSPMNNATMGRMIDHVAFSEVLNSSKYTKVLNSVDLSDDLPLISEWNIESLKSPLPQKRIDAEKMKELAMNFISDNRFSVLANYESNTENLFDNANTNICEAAEELGPIKTIKSGFRRSELKEKATKLCLKDRRNNKKAEVKKACDLMMGKKPRELWSWLKSFSGRFRSSLVNGPIFDKNRQLATYSETKAEVWTAHFEELAKDSTGNSISAEKWSDIGNDSAAMFSECDIPLSWAEICAALKSTPNNKSPGSDGIPSEA